MLTFDTTADQIHFMLDQIGMRLKVKQIIDYLTLMEELSPSDFNPDNHDLNPKIILTIIKEDNQERIKQNIACRFRIYENKDIASSCVSAIESFVVSQLEYGRTLLELSGMGQPKMPEAELQELRENFMQKWALRIPGLIEENHETTIREKDLLILAVNQANKKVKCQIKEAINCLSWREFESKFLGEILTALGFESFQITQQTRDRGQDTINCHYKDRLARREAIVSAKHWKSRNVGINEIQRVRGITGNADTGIIITSSKFTKDAKIDAENSPSFRKIVLIDGDEIVKTCFEKGIGVKPVSLPQLYEFDRLSISSG